MKRKKTLKKTVLILFGLTAAVCVGVMVGIVLTLIKDLPPIQSLEDFQPSATTRLYSAEGDILAELFVEQRDLVPLKEIPQHLKAGVLATEDRKFYQHSGIDIKGILRAVVKNLQAGEYVEGASTITQQLTKTLFLSPEKTLRRKIREAFLALQLERRYTKDEILELYLNQVYFGSGAYGAASAARIYFNKSSRDLTLAECALLAAMPRAPSRYSPLVNAPLAIKRRNVVLKQMVDTGVISHDEYNKARSTAFSPPQRTRNGKRAPYFVDFVKEVLEKQLGSRLLYRGGLAITTTLSMARQAAAERALHLGLDHLDNRTIVSEAAEKRQPVQGALVVLDIASGAIMAMVGGRDYAASAFNRTVSSKRQPGSAFKPFIYALAVENGIPQNRLILDAPVVFKGADKGRDWQPQNFSDAYAGETTLRAALARSLNIPAVRLIEQLGPTAVADFTRKLGITSPLAANLSLALGTSEVSLLELTAAYAVFANQGERVTPFGVMEVADQNGGILWRVQPQKTVAMSRAGAAIITDMLEAVVLEGTARRAQMLKRALAGKTGTTNQYKDALFVGYSPATAVGVWVGKDQPVPIGQGETGARAALPIWINFMAEEIERSPFQYFDRPDDVIQVPIDPRNGTVVDESTPGAVFALFKKGTQPR
jgi:penicillin-binding protein 1A